MLSSLQIENVAVIQKAEVHFKPGLNVLTGETGAGKSILIDSINAILGNRTSKDLVRTGASKAVIRAAFEEVPGTVLDSLEKAGYERSDALMLSREITAEGKSTCRINGMPATAAVLRELCGGLININGQHDSVGLLNPARHLAFWMIMRRTAWSFRLLCPVPGACAHQAGAGCHDHRRSRKAAQD